LLSVIQNKVEPSIIAHGQDKGPKPRGWDRPFVDTPSARRTPIKELIEHTVEFPERDESSGELIINYLGSRTEDYLESTVCVLSPHDIELGLIIVQALEILGTYLTSSPTAPLNKEFVEIESPLWYV
jgi:Zn-dependent M16 (insulinase) family peptidase